MTVPVARLIDDLRRRGVTLALDAAGGLSIRAPKGVLTESDRQALTARRDEVVGHLGAPVSSEADFPLTDIQQAYWVGRRSVALGNVGCHAYREFAAGDLDVALLEQAWARLVERHEMLRAVIGEEGRQRILPVVPRYRIRVIDDADDAALAALRAEMSHHIFDPAAWPLFDIRVVRRPEGCRVLIGMDLLIADATSTLLLYREWGQLYRDPQAVLPPVPRRFADYVRDGGPAPAARARAEAYWRARFDDMPGPPELPLAKPAEEIARPHFVRHSRTLGGARWQALARRARDAGLTPSNLLLSAYADVLAAWSKTQRFLVTLTTFRAPADYAGVVGDFTSTLLLEVDARALTFRERAAVLQRRLTQDLDHDGLSGVAVMRDYGRHHHRMPPSIPVVFTSALGHRRGAEAIAWLGDTVHAITQTPQVWIDHHVIEDGDDLVVSWDAVEELFPDGLIATMFGRYADFIEALAEGDAAWSAPLGFHLPAAQIERRRRANNTAAPRPAGLLHQPFLARAASGPDRIAVVTPDRRLTYGELAGRARAIAKRAGPGRLVGIAMDKGWQQVAAALGIVMAGGAYLPIDPNLPAARRRFLVENGGLDLVLTTVARADLDWPEGLRVLAVDDIAPETGGDDCPARPDDLAYVIYTSGSTGEPKGVMIEHRAALNTVVDINDRFGVGPDDAVLGLSALSFDLSVYDIFGVLGAGGRLVLPDPGRLRDPAHWLALMAAERVTVWNTVPAMLGMLVEHGADIGPDLRVVMMSGDWIPLGLPARVKAAAPNARIFGLGGATEAAIWSNWFEVRRIEPEWRSIPYGWPLANQAYHVLNEALEPAPDGVPGRLFIAGAGLARGYWRDPVRTDARFITHPRSGERLYETGDYGRYLPDGAIEFLGREDAQVKIRGHRIELGEVEAALSAHPRVRAAIAVATGEAGPGVDRRLVAYVVADGPAAEPAAGVLEAEPGVLTDPAARLDLLLRRPALRRDGGLRIALDPVETPAEGWRRRSVRHFDRAALPGAMLSRLLAALRARQDGDQMLPRYRYASAGASYAVQAWVQVAEGRVAGLPAGLYYYNPDRHDLEPLDGSLAPEAHAAINRQAAAEAGFTILLVAAYDAIRPLYGARARDFCLIEAGHIGQLLMEEAAAIGLGLCPVGVVDAAGLRLGPAQEVVYGFVGGLPTVAAAASDFGEVLRRWLGDVLPVQAIPEAIMVLDSLPLTANGKVDRGRLPKLGEEDIPDGDGAPATPLEETIAAIFAAVLERPSVGCDRPVFDLGGTSVHMVRIHRRLAETIDRPVDIVDLFRFPTVRGLARHIERDGRETASALAGAARGAARRQRRG